MSPAFIQQISAQLSEYAILLRDVVVEKVRNTSTTKLKLIALGSLFAYGVYRYYVFVRRYPTGPFPMPFIGNILQMDHARAHEALERIGKQQPGIYTLFMPFPYVQITEYDILREAFIEKGDDFAGRPQNRMIQEAFAFEPNTGVVNSNGEVWREQRRAAISVMKDLGMGKNVMEELVRSSVGDFIQHLDQLPDKTNVDLYWPIQVMVANVINEVLFGYRFAYDDCQPLMDYVNRFNEENVGFVLGLAFPFLADLPWIGWHVLGKTKNQMRQINQYIVDNVERSLADYRMEDESTCFVHAYKQRMAKNPNLDKVNLLSSCSDFFLASQETTTYTIRWAMVIMAKHVDIQERMRQEILSVVGGERLPTMADQLRMPYSRACVLELQRYANILGMNMIHTTVNDVTIRGQKIPAGTWVNGDIHYVMANDPVFENPKEFRPERYLDGSSLKRELVERTLPFSIGKRSCAGEGLARAEIFLTVTATVQHFRILPCSGEEIDLEPAMATTLLVPKPQGLHLERVKNAN